MAMNKKEQAEMESLRDQLRLAQALRYTEPVAKDVKPPLCGGLMTGFLYNACPNSWRVEPACSSSSYHSFGRDDKTDSQQPAWLYSTRLLALRACRNDAERRSAKWLAEIDEAIAEELAKQPTIPRQ